MSVEIDVELAVCAIEGPLAFPGALPYWCSRVADHVGAHQAWLGGRLLDSWPHGGESE